jgi:hypothetical protein
MRVKSKIEIKYPTWTYTPEYSVGFIYSENTYSGYLEGMPSMENQHNERVIKRITKDAKTFRPYGPEPLLYTGNIDTTKVFPYRANIAYLVEIERHLLVIWFDDGKTDILQSLESIIDDIDFKKNSKEFMW